MEYLIVKYFTREISNGELDKLVVWLKEEPNRQDLFFEMKDIYDAGTLRPTPQEIEDLWNRICFSIGANAAKKKSKATYFTKRYSLRQIVGCTASVALLFVALFLYKSNREESEGENVRLSEIYIPEEAGVMNLTLSDGTHVYLKANTRFKFPTEFDTDKREIYLDGEAFFDVAHDEAKPFIITTGKQRIEVLGTSLNVRDYPLECVANTTLVSGEVKLLIDGSAYVMQPNQQVSLNKLTNKLSLFEISEGLSSAFSNRKYHFKDKTLSSLFEDVEKLYGVKIRLQKKDIGSSTYTGTFSLDQSITEILEIINYKTQFAYGIKDKYSVTIY